MVIFVLSFSFVCKQIGYHTSLNFYQYCNDILWWASRWISNIMAEHELSQIKQYYLQIFIEFPSENYFWKQSLSSEALSLLYFLYNLSTPKLLNDIDHEKRCIMGKYIVSLGLVDWWLLFQNTNLDKQSHFYCLLNDLNESKEINNQCSSTVKQAMIF